MEEEVICLILLLSPESSHHPVQIAINMSRKTTIAQHERVCRLPAPCCRCDYMCTPWGFSLSFLSFRHIHKLCYSHLYGRIILPLFKSLDFQFESMILFLFSDTAPSRAQIYSPHAHTLLAGEIHHFKCREGHPLVWADTSTWEDVLVLSVCTLDLSAWTLDLSAHRTYLNVSEMFVSKEKKYEHKHVIFEFKHTFWKKAADISVRAQNVSMRRINVSTRRSCVTEKQ